MQKNPQTTRLSLRWGEGKEIAPEGDENNLKPDTSLEMCLIPLSLVHDRAGCPVSLVTASHPILGCIFQTLVPPNYQLHLDQPVWLTHPTKPPLIILFPLWWVSFPANSSDHLQGYQLSQKSGENSVCLFHSSLQLDQIRYGMNLKGMVD